MRRQRMHDEKEIIQFGKLAIEYALLEAACVFANKILVEQPIVDGVSDADNTAILFMRNEEKYSLSDWQDAAFAFYGFVRGNENDFPEPGMKNLLQLIKDTANKYILTENDYTRKSLSHELNVSSHVFLSWFIFRKYYILLSVVDDLQNTDINNIHKTITLHAQNDFLIIHDTMPLIDSEFEMEENDLSITNSTDKKVSKQTKGLLVPWLLGLRHSLGSIAKSETIEKHRQFFISSPDVMKHFKTVTNSNSNFMYNALEGGSRDISSKKKKTHDKNKNKQRKNKN